MTTRERWIVYPLLFLALGTAVKPKLVPPEMRDLRKSADTLAIEHVLCRGLQIVGQDGRPRFRFSTPDGGGADMQLSDEQGHVVLRLLADKSREAGLVETLNSKGQPQTVLMSSESGGEVVTFDQSKKNGVGIGFRSGKGGLFVDDLTTGKAIILESPGMMAK